MSNTNQYQLTIAIYYFSTVPTRLAITDHLTLKPLQISYYSTITQPLQTILNHYLP